MKEYENHPTQKPTALLERIILASSDEGDVILDPFAGTFTTSIVAMSLNRQSVSIDISKEYYKIGLRRVLGMKEYEGELLHPPRKTYKEIKQTELFNEVLT